jgi:hypothetical protein
VEVALESRCQSRHRGTIPNLGSQYVSQKFCSPLETFMARRRKNRTHLKGPAASSTANPVKDGIPKSFIIKHGQVGSSLTQLVRDMRKVMEPNTASRLKVSFYFNFPQISYRDS